MEVARGAVVAQEGDLVFRLEVFRNPARQDSVGVDMHDGAGHCREPEAIGDGLSGEAPCHGAQHRVDSARRELFDTFVDVVDAGDSDHRVRNFGDGTTLVVGGIAVGDIRADDLARGEATFELLDDGEVADPCPEMQTRRRPVDQRAVEVDCDDRPLL